MVGDDGRIARSGADLAGDRTPRRRRLRGQPRASSTCTPTCASRARRRPRPSRPAPGPRRSAATRASSPCPTPSRPSTTPASCARCSSSGATAPCDVRTSGAITVGRAGEQLAPARRDGRARRAVLHRRRRRRADARLMRRALEYAASLPGVVLAQHCEDPVLSAGGHMHEGEWSSRLGIPGQPAEAEELMVLRDIALARLTGTRVHFLHLSTARSVDLVRAAKADGLPVTAEASTAPLHAHRRAVRELRPRVQGEPAAAHRRRRRRGARRASPTAPSTPSPPTTRPTPRRPRRPPSTRRRPACSASRPRWRWPSPSSTSRSSEVLALLSWQPARILGVEDQHGGPVERRPSRQPLRDRPRGHLDGRARALASRSRNTPYAGRKLTGRVRHTVLLGRAGRDRRGGQR